MARKHQLQKILKKSRPYMHDRINHLKEFIEWKTLLKMKPKLISSTGWKEERTIYLKSGSSIIMIGSNTVEVIQRLFDLCLNRFQKGLEQSTKGSNFIFIGF